MFPLLQTSINLNFEKLQIYLNLAQIYIQKLLS